MGILGRSIAPKSGGPAYSPPFHVGWFNDLAAVPGFTVQNVTSGHTEAEIRDMFLVNGGVLDITVTGSPLSCELVLHPSLDIGAELWSEMTRKSAPAGNTGGIGVFGRLFKVNHRGRVSSALALRRGLQTSRSRSA